MKRIIIAIIVSLITLNFYGRNSNGSGGGVWSDASSWNSNLLPASTESVVILGGDHINVSGNLIHNANITIQDGAILELTGDINVSWGISVFVEEGGSLIVGGEINTRFMNFNNNGTVLTSNDFVQQDGGVVTNSVTGVITTLGDFVHNNGILNNFGVINSAGDLWFTDSGVSSNFGTMNVGGTMYHENGLLNNSGVLNIGGDAILSEGAQTNNSLGQMIITGMLSIPTWKLVFNYDGLIEWGIRDYIDPSIVGGTHQKLPVELLSFEASQNNDASIQLDWLTASEVNNDYFSIEVSFDGFVFSLVDEINGAGSSSVVNSYRYTDFDSYDFPVVYYRLKQTDYNGAYSYSSVITVVNSYPDADFNLPCYAGSGKYVEVPEDENAAIVAIVNSEGVIVAQAPSGGYIQIPSEKGVYFWQAQKLRGAKHLFVY